MATLTFHLIPHTHWDLEWYLPRAVFHARLVPMMDDLLDRLAEDPGFKSFLLDGQTVLVEDYLRVRPERAETIRNLARAGRLQVGPWYVLADELIPSGESLVRNLIMGAADAERWGGRLAVLYSPDAFGHPGCWPELARGAGLAAGVVWRGLGGMPGQDGDRYRWRGPSGAEVRLWHLPPAGYEVGAALAADSEGLPEAWAWVRGELVARAAGRSVPVFLGADHHGAPAAMSRLRDQLAELERPNIVRVSRLDEFFEAAADEWRAAPVLRGPLRTSPGYTWSLQGVHGTRAPLKRRAGAVESWLERAAEPLAALARWRGGGDYRPQLEQAWRTLVQCQFHDTICGTTSDAVTREAELKLEAARSYADEVVREAAFDLVRHDPDRARARPEAQAPRLLVWNPAPHVREGILVTDVTVFRGDVIVGPPGARVAREGTGFRSLSLRLDDRAVPIQILDRRPGLERLDARRHYPDMDAVDRVRVALRVPALPGFGIAALTSGPATPPPSPPAASETAEVQGRSLVNRFVVVTVDRTGALLLYDRRTGGRWLDLLRLESAGDAGDAYSYCPPARDRVLRSEGPIRVRRRAAGPLVAALDARWTMRAGRRGRVEVTLTVVLYADSPAVRCFLDIDNQASNHRLRARVPTGILGPVTAGAQFGQETWAPSEPPLGRQALEAPVATAPAHRYVALSGGPRGGGLAILAPGFFEYEHTPAGELIVTLLRSIGLLSRDDLPTRPGHAAWPTAIPAAQCLGPSRVELALVPLVEGDFLPALWEGVFAPLRGFWIRDAVDLVVPTGSITLEGTGLVLSALKPSFTGRGDEIVLRCYNATADRRTGAWRLSEAARAAYRARLDERDAMPLILDDGGRVVRFHAEPHEITTIVIRR